MLKRIRITLSVILFSLITLYFLDFREFLPDRVSFLAEIQLIPALLALNIVILVSLAVLTLLFGRIYCSSICPMGVYQDIVAWFSKKLNRKKKYRYSNAKTVLRWSVLAGTTAAFIFGFTFLLGLLDPYGAYGRIVTHLLRPAYLAGNNLLEIIFTSFNNYTFYKVSIYTLSIFSLVTALITLLIIGYMAWRNGRTWCNTICPVGTTLGFLSKFSLFRIRFVDEKCNMCGLCAMKCKASCIDSKNKQVDYSRCVTCFNCIESCNRDAMKYTLVRPGKKKETDAVPAYTYVKEEKQVNESKRRFLSASLITGLAAGNLVAQTVSDSIFRGGTSNTLSPEGISGDFLPRREFKRQIPIAPPGTPTFDHLREKCISCHLCVSKCPSHVIKPAFLEYGLGGIMQPKLYFDHGFCNYDCTICGEVCPTGAILPLTKEEKNHTQMGQVQLIIENCIVYYDETSCGACSEHCPTQAVHMVPYKGMLTIPEIRPEICVGCGGCEYVCPAIPYKAIYVEGLRSQNIIEIEHEEVDEIVIDDFGF
ncbi:4Fe-4S binding protein [Proteiniphilum acetatigenes]|uniref:4Fe-4S binding protein n=1 Tax=Proteiniphilum acetatigenes TaxID=294710 RepID=UPI000367B3FB|nr:4Fe-4S binding protein [Proteiniphilum acetatigenes]SEA19745.1 4Fe-4S binding domain-containing protein [Porphyromonadaceae bacterium KH3R12]